MIKRFKDFILFESLMDKDYHISDKKTVNKFMQKIIKAGKVNGRYILLGYRNELKDFALSFKKYKKGEISKKELGKRWISFLKLLGITAPTIIHSVLTITIILAFKKWGLERYLPDAFQDDYGKKKEIISDDVLTQIET